MCMPGYRITKRVALNTKDLEKLEDLQDMEDSGEKGGRRTRVSYTGRLCQATGRIKGYKSF